MIREDEILWHRPLGDHFPVDNYSGALECTEVRFDQLRDHDVLRIATDDHRYQIRILRAADRTALMEGGPSFNDWAPAVLEGSAKQNGCDPHGICVGHPLVVTSRNRKVTTQPVRSIEVCR